MGRSGDQAQETRDPRILLGLGERSIIFCKGKAGDWAGFPEEGFKGVTANIMPQDMANYDIMELVREGSP